MASKKVDPYEKYKGSWFMETPTNPIPAPKKAKNYVPASSPNKKFDPKKYKQEYKKQYKIKANLA